MSRAGMFRERVMRMAMRNGLQHTILPAGAVQVFKQGAENIRLTVSIGQRPCRVVIQFADGTQTTEEWVLLEAAMRNLAR